MSDYYELRAFVGGQWSDGDDPTRHDWTFLRHGNTGTNFSQTTATTASVSVGATSINVSSTSVFPAAGRLFLQATGGGPWLHFAYLSKTSTKFNGVTWFTAADEVEGATTVGAGATVRQWIPLTQDVSTQMAGSVQITKTTLGQFAGTDYSATISGWNVDRQAIANNHLVVVEYRMDPTGVWAILVLGWLDQPNYRDDAGRTAQWGAQIVSSATMADRTQTNGLTVGDRDIALSASVTGSPALAYPYKEAHLGEYREAVPDLSPARILDGSDDTIWISDQLVGDHNFAESNGDPHWSNTGDYDTQVVISMVHLEEPPGSISTGYRFIELTVVPQPPNGTTNLNSHWIITEKQGKKGLTTPLEKSDYEIAERLLIVENRELFLKRNPTNAAAAFLEMPDPAWWDGIDPAGDTIMLRRNRSPYTITHMVSWGNATGVIPGEGSEPGDTWIGPKVPAPQKGESLRYTFIGASTTPADYWIADHNYAPGYTIGYYGGDDDGWNQGKIWPVYLKIELPGLQLFLAEEMGDASDVGNGDFFRIIGPDGEGNTQGLPVSGTLQIGYEHISYINKTEDGVTCTGRGLTGTAIASHVSGDPIFLLHNGIATTGAPVEELKWHKNSVSNYYPQHFDIYVSSLGAGQQRTPNEAGWENDWVQVESVVGYVANTSEPGRFVWAKQFTPPLRPTHVMMVFWGMTHNPARPRLNRFIVNVYPGDYESSTWMQASAAAATLFANVLTNCGALPGGSMTAWATTHNAISLNLQNGPAYSSALDIADYAHAFALCEIDGHITIQPHEWLEAATVTPSRSWSRENVRNIANQHAPGQPVAQFRMTYTTPAGDTGEAVYPSEGTRGGQPTEIGEYIAAGQSEASNSVRWRHLLARSPHTALIEIASAGLDIYPGEVHRLTWDMGPNEIPGGRELDRIYAVESVDHFFENHALATTVHLVQIGREAIT